MHQMYHFSSFSRKFTFNWLVKRIFCHTNLGFKFPSTTCIICFQATYIIKIFHTVQLLWYNIICNGDSCLEILITSEFSTFISIPLRLTTSNHIHLLIFSIAGDIIKLIPAVSQSVRFQILYLNTKKYWWYIENVDFIHSHTSEKVSEPLVSIQGERIHNPLIFHEICSYIYWNSKSWA